MKFDPVPISLPGLPPFNAVRVQQKALSYHDQAAFYMIPKDLH